MCLVWKNDATLILERFVESVFARFFILDFYLPETKFVIKENTNRDSPTEQKKHLFFHPTRFKHKDCLCLQFAEKSGSYLSLFQIQISTIRQTKICSAQIGISKNGISRFTAVFDLKCCNLG